MNEEFPDRMGAGRALAERLQTYAGRADVLVLALPRGGVPVAFEVARTLAVAMDVLVVRKLGVPHQPELAMGAIASGGALYLNDEVIRAAGVTEAELLAAQTRERAELERRERTYRGARAALQLQGKTVIVVDDGIATGASMRAALLALRSQQPARIVVATPVAPAGAAGRLRGAADEVVCLRSPENFHAVGQFYRDFGQTTDAEVRDFLARAGQMPG